VTGTFTRIGTEVYFLFAEKGAQSVAAAWILSNSEGLVREIEPRRGEALAAATDVKKREEADSLVAFGIRRFGGIGILANGTAILREMLKGESPSDYPK